MPHVGSTTPTRTRRMTSPKVGLSGSGSCRAHERTWSSNCLISTAPMSGVVMSVCSQLAHLTTNTCHRRSDISLTLLGSAACAQTRRKYDDGLTPSAFAALRGGKSYLLLSGMRLVPPTPAPLPRLERGPSPRIGA